MLLLKPFQVQLNYLILKGNCYCNFVMTKVPTNITYISRLSTKLLNIHSRKTNQFRGSFKLTFVLFNKKGKLLYGK